MKYYVKIIREVHSSRHWRSKVTSNSKVVTREPNVLKREIDRGQVKKETH
jgi:hypothetical protein